MTPGKLVSRSPSSTWASLSQVNERLPILALLRHVKPLALCHALLIIRSAADMAFSRTNNVFCDSCQNIFVGSWVPWRTPTSPDSRWKIYQFHGTLQSLQDCAKDHGCPLCKVAVAAGDWKHVDAGTEMTFSHIFQEDCMIINFTPNGATSDLIGCFINMRRGRSPWWVTEY